MTGAEALRLLAADIMGARDVPLRVRLDIVTELYHRADALEQLPRPRHPLMARAVDLVGVRNALNDSEFIARPYTAKLANRLLEALDLVNSHSDSA